MAPFPASSTIRPDLALVRHHSLRNKLIVGESLRGSIFEPRRDRAVNEHQRADVIPVVFFGGKRLTGPSLQTNAHTSDMKSDVLHISGLKVGAIINTSSGGCDSESEAEMLDILKDAGVTNYKTWCGESDQIKRAFAEAATHKPNMLVVLGGDGTIRTAAEACTGTGTYLLPLPGGTLNMLPRALYGDAPWQNALKDTLADPVIKVLSGGRVADANALFFVAAVVGAPGLWMEAREAIREGDILDAVHKGGIAFEAMFDTTIQYFISPEVSGEAEVVTVICPLVSEQMSDSEQTLEAAAIAVANAAEVLGLVTAAAFGKWRENKRVTLSKTDRVTVKSSSDIPLFLDGERANVGKNAEITFVPKAVNVIVPANLSTKFS